MIDLHRKCIDHQLFARMMNLIKIISCSLLLLMPFGVEAQLGGILAKKIDKAFILNSPSVGDYMLQDTQYKYFLKLKDGYPEERAAWIVYSDRANNTTYQNPGSENQPLAALDFMQACFVIGEKSDYVELVAYVPGINMSKAKKYIDSPKYLGWVKKNTLLLWNRALKDKLTNYFLKSVTSFGTERVFSVLPSLVEGDSLLTFSSPFLSQPNGKCGMESIFYIYKESATGNEYLVGPDPSFLPEDAAKSGVGWISKDLIRIWGTQGFISMNREMKSYIPFYKTAPRLKGGVVQNDPLMVARSPYATPKSDLEQLYPILKYRTTDDGRAVINTGFLADVLDKMNSRIYNISGELIHNEDMEKFSTKSSVLNIMVVIAGGVKNGQYFSNLQGVLETSGWLNTANKHFNQVNVGAVVYNDYNASCPYAATPLTDDLDEIDAFLTDQRSTVREGCDNGNYYQAVFGGVAEAAKMLRGKKDESNIILLYGSGTDEMGNIGEALKGIISVQARLLVFQTHNIANEIAYRKFVEDAKDLISKSSFNITELKKRLIVSKTYARVFSNNVGYTSGPDSTTGSITFLDYPSKSLTQGYILFPNDGENMPTRYLADYLDTMIGTIALDNRIIDNALHAAIAQAGTNGTKLKPEFAAYFPGYVHAKLPAAFLKANTLRNQKFLLPAWTILSGNQLESQQEGLSSGVLLSQRELTDFANQMALLGGKGVYTTKEQIVKHIIDAVEAAQRDQANIYKPLKELTFSEAMGYVTGYFPMDRAWLATTLSQFQSSSKISTALGQVFLEESRNKAAWLRDQYNNPALQYRNNGRIYYIIKEDNLPINTVISDYPKLNNDPVIATTNENASDTVLFPHATAPTQDSRTAEIHLSEKVPLNESNLSTIPIQNQEPTPAVKTSAPVEVAAKRATIGDISHDLGTVTLQVKKQDANTNQPVRSSIDTVNYRQRLSVGVDQQGTPIPPTTYQEEAVAKPMLEDSSQVIGNDPNAADIAILKEEEPTSIAEVPVAPKKTRTVSGNIADITKDFDAVTPEPPKKEKGIVQQPVDTTNYWQEIEVAPVATSPDFKPTEQPTSKKPKKQTHREEGITDITADLNKFEVKEAGNSKEIEGRDAPVRTDTVNYRKRLAPATSEPTTAREAEVVPKERKKERQSSGRSGEDISDIQQDFKQFDATGSEQEKKPDFKAPDAEGRKNDEKQEDSEHRKRKKDLKHQEKQDINRLLQDLNNAQGKE